MKKILVLIIAVAALSSCNTGSKKPTTEMDSLSYAFGVDMGSYFKMAEPNINGDMLAQAIKDIIQNDSARMSQEEAYRFINEYMMVRKPAKTKADSEAFLAQVEKENKNVKKTESGLLYEIIAEGGEKATNDADTVEVNYIGTLRNGTEFDNSYTRGQPAVFPLNGVIRGWTEGMKLVGKGGKIKLWIPSDLGYGAQGAGQMIGPNEALVFEVELLNVKPVAAAE